MSQQHIVSGSRYAACGAVAAALLLTGVSSAKADQWASKPAPFLPRSVLDQGVSGSVVLGLVFESNGSVKDARITRSSGNAGLDQLAREGAMRWRLNPASLQASDFSTGRQHMIKFYQDGRVARRVEPIKAIWKEM